MMPIFDGSKTVTIQLDNKSDIKDVQKDAILLIITIDGQKYVFQTLAVTVTESENGKVTTDKAVYKVGETVELTVAPDEGYELESLLYVGSDGKETQIEDNTFTMPESGVTVTAEFAEITVPTYRVKVTDGIQNGTVVANPANNVKEGVEVVLNVTPTTDNYMLKAGSLKVTDGTGAAITVAENNTFTMPASDVTVTAEFVPKVPCKVTFDKDEISVFVNESELESGATVPTGTVVTVEVKKVGYTVSPALEDGEYTVVKDVTFIAVEKEYEDASFSGSISTDTTFSETQLVTVPSDSVLQKGTEITINGKLYVPAGVTLTISTGAELTINGVADIQGNLVIEAADEIDGDEVDAGLFLVDGEATIGGKLDVGGSIKTSQNGKIVIAAAAEIAGEISGNFEISQDAVLTITGSVENTAFTVYGNLTVNSEIPTGGFAVEMKENGVLAIENVVLGTTSMNVGNTHGTIRVTDDGVFYNDKEDKKLDKTVGKNQMTISGELTVVTSEGEGSYKNASAYGASVSGITVSVSSTVTKVTAEGADKDKMKHVSVMSVSGNVTVGEYISYNEVEYDGGKVGPVAVEDTLNANIKVIGAEESTVKIDKDLSFGADIVASFQNVDVAAPVTFVEELTLKNAVVGGNITVPTEAKLTIDGTFDVKATVDASAADSKDPSKNAILNAGSAEKITVSDDGSILANKAIERVAALNATMYGTYVYVSFDKAVAALNAGTTKTVSVYGEQVLNANAEIPAMSNAVVMQKDSHLDIGTKDNTEVVLTIASANGVVLKNSSSEGIEVYGTLYAEKMTNVDGSLRADKIGSDVYSCALTAKGAPDANGFAKWTNIYTALAEAKSGETVTIQRDIAGLKSVTINDGVTLDANGKTVTVAQKAVLTVVGTLDLTDDGSNVVLAEPTMENDKVKTVGGAIAYTGYILYKVDAVPVTQEDLVLPGAYYVQADKDVNVLTTYANGAADALKAKDYTVTLKADKDGKIALGEISFVGEKDKVVKILVEKAALTGTVSLSYADFAIAINSTVDAKFVSGTDSIAVKANVGENGALVQNGALGDDVVLMISGALGDIDDKTETSVVFEGSVFIAKAFGSDVDEITVNGDLVVCGVEDAPATFEVRALDVAGTVAVKNGSDLKVEKMTVSGAVKVEDGNVEAIEATVSGSIDASAVDEDGKELATFAVGILYIGVDSKIVKPMSATAAAASVIGNVVMTDYALAAPDATVPEAFEDAEKYKSTVFVAEDKDYVIAYVSVSGNTTLTIGQIVYDAKDATFENWENEGKDASNESAGEFDEVTAKIKYDIYTVRVVIGAGIENVAIEGNLVTAADELSLKAGTYEVTYTHEHAYSGTATLSVNGEKQPGMTFTVSGEPATYVLQISGVSASQPVTPVIPVTPSEKDDGLTITDYLLIVLVVLIVIMAVIVAMRLMRS